MPPDWIEEWYAAAGGTLTPDQLRFLREAERDFGAGTRSLWSGNREFVRFALEGPADAPRLVCYLRWEALHPGQLIRYDSPLPTQIESASPVLWYVNFLEDLEAAPHPDAGPDGIIRLTAWPNERPDTDASGLG
jgi:hypothetical protein